jgi:D-inositol-3-phosphate glycosyltransferase
VIDDGQLVGDVFGGPGWLPSRVAMISVHTSPLDQPGTGDAGGLNVYVVELATRLARYGVEVEIFTRATSGDLPPRVEIAPGVLVRHIVAGPFAGLTKHELPAQLCVFAREVLRMEASLPPGHYDLVHSHYWLSGQVGALASDRWNVPLVHTMHTMAKVKNLALAIGDTPEPATRVIGEELVVETADLLIANTKTEAEQLIDLYDASPGKVRIVHPGVDLEMFRPGDRRAARARLGIPPDDRVIMFAGRLQPLKGPDITLQATAELLDRSPDLRGRLRVLLLGGASGSGLDAPTAMSDLAVDLGLHGVVSFVPPVDRGALAAYFQAADVVTMPSYNESFGLVALEAQACGTPVVAARVGGLTTAVTDGVGGILVDGHDPADYANQIERLFTVPGLLERTGAAAARYAARFSWDGTTSATLAAYDDAAASHVEGGRALVGSLLG